MSTVTARAGLNQDWTPVTQTGGSLMNYLSILREAFTEALQQTREVRRKFPFADV